MCMVCIFPNIEYSNSFLRLRGKDGDVRPVPKSMITLLSGQGSPPEFHFIKKDFSEQFDNDINKLEQNIFDCVCGYHPGDDLESIFHKIQIWGGITGRNIYVRQNFSWSPIAPKYQELVDACLNINDLSEESIDKLYDAFVRFREVKFIDVSFTTKHIHFWTYVNLKQDAFPIFDKVMSENLLNKKVNFGNLKAYWRDMINKSKEENVNLISLERQLFNNFQL